MADKLKSKHKVTVFGSEYLIEGETDEQYVKTLADYVDGKMQEISTALHTVTTANVAVLAAINIADELFRLKRRYREFQEEVDRRLAAMSRLLNGQERDNEEVEG